MGVYKNWPEICKLSGNNLLMATVATLDTESAFGKRFTAAFPKFFSETEIVGPVPLSILREAGRKGSMLELGNCDGESHLVCYQATSKYNIPVVKFDGQFPDNFEERHALPDHAWLGLTTGDIVAWKGDRWVMVDKDDERICIAPAECIDVNS